MTQQIQIHWTNVRNRYPSALIAENAQNHGCEAQARLWHQPTEQRPWLLEVTVTCAGKSPWTRRQSFIRLPAATSAYLKARDAATRLLLRYARQ